MESKILIVDDESSTREMLKHSLTMENYHCLEACNSLEAEAVIRAEQPDLILLDWMLQDVAAIDFLRKIKSDDMKGVPVIIIEAKAGESCAVEGLNAGAEDCIASSVSIDELKARIKSIMRRVYR